MSDLKDLEKEYPCLAAVNRCANSRTWFWPLIMTAFRPSTLPNMIVCSSCSCASSSGQSYQTAVLWRRTDPEDTHAGGQGERKCMKTVEHSSVCVWTFSITTAHALCCFVFWRASPMTLVEPTSRLEAAWLACTGTSVVQQLSLASSR